MNYFSEKMDDIINTPNDGVLYGNNSGVTGNARQWLVTDLQAAQADYSTARRKRVEKWTDIYFAMYQARVAENNAKKKRKTIKKSATGRKVA